MAQHQHDISKGQDAENSITRAGGSSIGSAAVRVTIDDANAGSKLNAVRALEATIRKIQKSTWPPV